MQLHEAAGVAPRHPPHQLHKVWRPRGPLLQQPRTERRKQHGQALLLAGCEQRVIPCRRQVSLQLCGESCVLIGPLAATQVHQMVRVLEQLVLGRQGHQHRDCDHQGSEVLEGACSGASPSQRQHLLGLQGGQSRAASDNMKGLCAGSWCHVPVDGFSASY